MQHLLRGGGAGDMEGRLDQVRKGREGRVLGKGEQGGGERWLGMGG